MRFLGQKVPATGASIGVDRLLAALEHLDRIRSRKATARVLVTRMDEEGTQHALEMTWQLRRAGIPAEVWLGKPKQLGKQLKHADLWEIPIALIAGEDERTRGVVTLKDMDVGRRLAGKIDEREEWLAERPGQREVRREDLVESVLALLREIG